MFQFFGSCSPTYSCLTSQPGFLSYFIEPNTVHLSFSILFIAIQLLNHEFTRYNGYKPYITPILRILTIFTALISWKCLKIFITDRCLFLMFRNYESISQLYKSSITNLLLKLPRQACVAIRKRSFHILYNFSSKTILQLLQFYRR